MILDGKAVSAALKEEIAQREAEEGRLIATQVLGEQEIDLEIPNDELLNNSEYNS